MLVTNNCWIRECKYYLGIKQYKNEKANEYEEKTERDYCEAFPDGIPDEIAYGDNKHSEPVLGQENEIVYEREE